MYVCVCASAYVYVCARASVDIDNGRGVDFVKRSDDE